MSHYTVYYNTKKLYGLFFISILLLILMLWVFVNANELAYQLPSSGSSRYNWVGHLVYKRPVILYTLCIVCGLLCLGSLVLSIVQLSKKSVTFQNIDKNLYQGNKLIIPFSNIKYIHVSTHNSNKYLAIQLKNPEKYINSQTNIIKQYLAKINYKFHGSPIFILTTFYEEKPGIIKDRILKLQQNLSPPVQK